MVLSPRITARTMALHPAVAFGAVIAGGAIMGPIGSLLALPAAASVQSLVSIYLHRYEVIASPLTGAPEAAAVPASQPPSPGLG
jgi:predicted PurR-regulated permease PerM